MSRILIIVGLAISITAGTVWAIDMNPAEVRGGNMWDKPSDYESEGVLKKLYVNSNPAAHPEYVYGWNDGYIWYYDNDPYRSWAYMLYKFVLVTGYETGTLRWKVWAESGNTVTIKRWGGSSWVDVDSGTGNSIHYENGIDHAWFSEEGSMWLLVEVETTTGDPGVSTDVVDIQYEFSAQ